MQRDRLVDHYIRAFGLWAIYLIGARNLTRVGVAHNPAAALKAQRVPGAEILKVWWSTDRAEAIALAEALAGSDARTAEDMIARMPAIAGGLGFAIADDAAVRARAFAAIAEVDASLKAMKERGELRAVSRAYRSMREDRAARGRGAMPWPVYWRRYVITILYQIARQARAVSGVEENTRKSNFVTTHSEQNAR